MRLCTLILLGLWLPVQPGAKAMFYDPGDRGAVPAIAPGAKLRPIDTRVPFLHCGIHYWLETEKGEPVTERTASGMPGKFTLHIRNNVAHGLLTVWDVSGEGRELTPKDPRYSGGGQWSGYGMTDEVYVVPGVFEFTRDESPRHIVIVWARSQTEVAGSAARARQRLVDMPAWMSIVRESEESTAGEIGTYVMNRSDGGVSAEIVFRAR